MGYSTDVPKFTVEGAKVTQNGTKVTIEFDTATDIGESKSGSGSLIIASSRGNQRTRIGDEVVYLSLNAYKFPARGARSTVDAAEIDGRSRGRGGRR